MEIELTTSWPFLVLVGVLSMGYTLLLQPYGSSPSSSFKAWRRRLDDPAWWMQLGLPLYMLHQFEEYGIDLKGRHFRFQETLCSNLGFSTLLACPIKPWHTSYVNLVLVSLAALRARPQSNWRGPGANFWGVVLVNGLFHCAMAGKAANKVLSGKGVARAVAVGVVAHIGVFSGLILRSGGKIGDVGFVLWELANWTIPLTLAFP
ncbi:hypothetical protein JCM10207_008162 [Rhodosporidiobolus poonsookiae]